jgi:sulfonate transport system substrate-binding protein
MKILGNILYVLAIAFAVSECTQSENKSEPLTVLRVGSRSVTNPQTLRIQSENLFKKHGLNAKVEYIVGANGPILMEMFLAGKIDIAVFGDQPAVMGWLRGVDVKAVANFPSSPRSTYIMVADSQHIKTMQDLKGKKISVQIGTVSQHWLFLTLDQAGMKPSDVKMLNVPGGDASIALMTKEIDAAVLSEPTISLLEERKVAAKLKESHCAKTYSEVLLVSGNFYRNHPEFIKNIIATYYEANSWLIDNPVKSVKLISSNITYKAVATDVLKRQYGKNLSKVKYLGFTDSAKLSFKKIVEFLKDLKVVPQHGTLADSTEKFYDSRFVDEYYNDRAKKENTTVGEIINSESRKKIEPLKN